MHVSNIKKKNPYLREGLRVLHRGRRGRGDHRGGGAELRVLAPAAHRARTAGAPIAANK